MKHYEKYDQQRLNGVRSAVTYLLAKRKLPLYTCEEISDNYRRYLLLQDQYRKDKNERNLQALNNNLNPLNIPDPLYQKYVEVSSKWKKRKSQPVS